MLLLIEIDLRLFVLYKQVHAIFCQTYFTASLFVYYIQKLFNKFYTTYAIYKLYFLAVAWRFLFGNNY
jgi:hypothetical protein